MGLVAVTDAVASFSLPSVLLLHLIRSQTASKFRISTSYFHIMMTAMPSSSAPWWLLRGVFVERYEAMHADTVGHSSAPQQRALVFGGAFQTPRLHL